MSRNGYIDYMDVTGYLPRIERSRAVCWKGDQLYIKGNACYVGAPKYLNADETREYMSNRFGYKMATLKGKTFDEAVTADKAKQHLDQLTITDTGRFIYNAGMPVTNAPGNIRESVVYSDSKDGIQRVSTIGPPGGDALQTVTQEKGGDMKGKTSGIMLGVVAVIAAIGYLLVRGK